MVEDPMVDFPGMLETTEEALEGKGLGTEEGCEYVRSRDVGGGGGTSVRPCPSDEERRTEELWVSFKGRGPVEDDFKEVADNFLGVDRGIVDDGSLGGNGGGEISSSPASGVMGRRKLEEEGVDDIGDLVL